MKINISPHRRANPVLIGWQLGWQRDFRLSTILAKPALTRRFTVELRGFEPLTSSMPWKRATNCAKAPCGSRGRDRAAHRPERPRDTSAGPQGVTNRPRPDGAALYRLDPPVGARAVSVEGQPGAVEQAAREAPALERDADQPAGAHPARQPVWSPRPPSSRRLGRLRDLLRPQPSARPPPTGSLPSANGGRPRRHAAVRTARVGHGHLGPQSVPPRTPRGSRAAAYR